ncbi:MAG: nitroreductase family deazaflavin-dependent oxidoreductase [Baekduia sp.]
MSEPKKGLWGSLTSRATAPPPGSAGHRMMLVASAFNTWVYRASGGRLGGSFDGAPLVLVHHVGAKSGEHRVVPLLGMPDGDDLVIVASYGGAPKTPAWFFNLKANPDTRIELKGRVIDVTASVVPEPERSELWPRLVEFYAAYGDYQRKTERVIPLIRLTPAT